MHSGRPSAIHAVNETKLHVLIPANNPDVNLCKTLLTANALGYPDPTLLAWGEAYDTGEDAWYCHQGLKAAAVDRRQIICLEAAAIWPRSVPC